MKTFYSFLFIGCIYLPTNATAQVCLGSLPEDTPDERFTYNDDAAPTAVIDNITGLMWKRCSEGLSGTDCGTGTVILFDWQGALQWASDVNAGNAFDVDSGQAGDNLGHDDWRVPNVKELVSIVEYACFDPAINISAFPNTPPSVYWTSSPCAFPVNGFYSSSWRLHFNYGGFVPDLRIYNRLIRLVREVQ